MVAKQLTFIKYRTLTIYLIIATIKWCKSSQTVGHHFKIFIFEKTIHVGKKWY
jgi:hypothetical protein